MIVVSFSGMNETMLQRVQAHKIYGTDNIQWGEKFVDILSVKPDGELSMDYSRFHEVESPNKPRG